MPRIRRRSTAPPMLVAVLSSLVVTALVAVGCSRSDRTPATPAVPPSTTLLA
ncbi:MAG: hypothetical protein H0T70_06510, partial [Acidimicrobiia bacterium]|nr:hypothetical protein [Acidimicrobiia bacterium]